MAAADAGHGALTEEAKVALWANIECIPPIQSDIFSRNHVGDYQLLKYLGEGEFAKVQSCRKKGENILYAVKHVSKSRLMRSTNLKRVLRGVRRVGAEIQAMQAVDSAYVCKLFEVMHSEQHVHLVMEKGGTDLYDLIGDKLNLAAARTILLFLARGLSAALDQGVAHRDLKPENVLVKAQLRGGYMVVDSLKLCDFGLCAIAPVVASLTSRHRRLQEGKSGALSARLATESPETATDAAKKEGAAVERNWIFSEFVGSPGFVAPEIVMGGEYDGKMVDAFSLGCIMLELVLGHDAFDSIWMNTYSNDSMSNGVAFRMYMDLAQTELRKVMNEMPEEVGTTPAEGSARDHAGDGTDATPHSRAGAVAAMAHRCKVVDPSPDTIVLTDTVVKTTGLAGVKMDSPPSKAHIAIDIGKCTLMELLFGLLEVDPTKRLTVHQATNHRYLAAPAAAVDGKLASSPSSPRSKKITSPPVKTKHEASNSPCRLPKIGNK